MIQIIKKLFAVASPRGAIDDDVIRSAYVLSKIEGWLEDEMAQYQEYEDEMAQYQGVDSFEDGRLEGRDECAESLIRQIAKWRLEI